MGFALYGQSDGEATVQNVTIVITNYEEDSVIAEFTKEMKVTDGGGESEVFFPHPVPLDALEWYTFAVSTPVCISQIQIISVQITTFVTIDT